MEILGQYIRKLIKYKGYTVSEFAERIHVSRRAMYDLFKRNNIDTELLIRISEELNVNLLDYVQLLAENKHSIKQNKSVETSENQSHFLSFSIPTKNNEFQNPFTSNKTEIEQILKNIEKMEEKIKEFEKIIN
ncbi:MAG: helix-turn-helix domain-containing protein, partial [Bacteroidales bacterium]|nr:helix-turn-helix domain-containing protein [Bacteroidales bacterium]